MEKFSEFKNLMEEYDSLLDRLTKVENSKIMAISQDKIEELESIMRAEEAEMLRMRGLDSKRKKLLEESGYGRMTFSQVVDSLEGKERDVSEILRRKMQEKTKSLRELSASAANMIEAKLINIDELIARNNNPPAGAAYNRSGAVPESKDISKIGSLSV